MANHQPELGQALFGQPWQAEAATPRTEALLRCLSTMFYALDPSEAVYSENPFSNSGARIDHALLRVHAYSWNDDEEQPWNLAWRDWRVSWYKHAGRGVTQNRSLTPAEVAELFADALTVFTAHFQHR